MSIGQRRLAIAGTTSATPTANISTPVRPIVDSQLDVGGSVRAAGAAAVRRTDGVARGWSNCTATNSVSDRGSKKYATNSVAGTWNVSSWPRDRSWNAYDCTAMKSRELSAGVSVVMSSTPLNFRLTRWPFPDTDCTVPMNFTK